MFLRVIGVVVGTAVFGQLNPSSAEKSRGLSLDDFVPAEIESRYRSEPCKIDTGGPCALWTAEGTEPRYMIFRRSLKNSNLLSSAQAISMVRAVAPDSVSRAPPQVRALARKSSSDPANFAVSSASLSGRVQVIDVKDEALAVWMPDERSNGSFETVDVTAVDTPAPQQIAEIRVANQPDLIDEDSGGFLWFSAWNNEIYRIDPNTDLAEPMTGGTATGTPDGMIVDSNDNIWFAAYSGHYLGTLSDGAPVTRYDVPYPGGSPAIPCEDPSGNIWVTDHIGNRVMEFDVVAQDWKRAVQMPVSSAWVTQCKRNDSGTALWMTMYQARSLGRLDLDTLTIERYPVPCAPAFLSVDARGVWAGCWDSGHIVQFDPVTLTGRLFRIPMGSGAGGISIDGQGRIVFAQNALGRAAVLDPASLEVFTYQLPSRPVFKDSILVARTGNIWVPSPAGQLVGKIVP